MPSPGGAMLQVRVAHLGLDRTTNTPVVILQENDGQRVLPIWIGPAEASAIAMELAGVKFSRPLTHDLLKQVIVGLGAELRKVIITQVKDNTYFAELHIYRGDTVIQIDARPSDSIALALRLKAPIMTSETLLELTSIDTSDGAIQPGSAGSPLDSVRSDARGRYRLALRNPDSTSGYVVSVWYDSIAYFSLPLTVVGRPAVHVEDIVAFPASRTGPSLRLVRRLATISAATSDGSREVLEILELENPGQSTRITDDTVAPTWSGRLPEHTGEFRAEQGDVSPEAVRFRNDSVLIYAPTAPGPAKQLSYDYALAAGARAFIVPIDQPTVEVNLLIEDTAAVVIAPKLESFGVKEIEGRRFAAYRAGPLAPSERVELPLPTGKFRAQMLLPYVIGVLAVVMVLAMIWALRKRPSAVSHQQSVS